MTTQPDLFDALRRVEEHADDDWKIRDGMVIAIGWTTQGRAAAHGRPRRLYRGRAQ